MTGSTTGRGASWILYQVPDEGQLVQIAQGSAENTQFQDTPIHFGGYIVKWFDDQGAEGSEVCEFKPHRLFAPFIADQVPPVCLNMTADVPTDHPIYAGRQVTFTVSVQDTATVFFERQEQVPVDGIATFTLSVDPGVTYFPSLQAMHGPIVEAPNCAIRYEPFSEEIERFTIIYADPEYIVREYTGQAEIDWVNGQFGTTIGRTRDGSYNLDLNGPEGPNGEKIAYAAGLLGPSEMVFGFKKIKSSFVYHHEVGWTEDGVSALITELGTNVWESGNPNPIQFATEPGETGTPWSAELVGQGRYLPNGTYYVAGRFNDYRNTNTPVWAVRNECIGLVALRENVPSSTIPHSGKFLLLQYTGCDDNAWNGYLSPLLRGDDDVRNPNDYRRDSLVPVINAASAEEETHIEFQPATVDLEWDR